MRDENSSPKFEESKGGNFRCPILVERYGPYLRENDDT